MSVTGIYVGAMAAKKGAEILEEFNIFTPEDDDDWTLYKNCTIRNYVVLKIIYMYALCRAEVVYRTHFLMELFHENS